VITVHFESRLFKPFPENQFIISDWRDKVDYGMEFSYRPARLQRLTGRYDNPMHYSILLPVRNYEFGYRQFKYG
jgi:hypothetical protein